MKKLIWIVTILMFISQVSWSQVSAGRIFVGTGLGFTSQSGKKTVKKNNSTTDTKFPNTTTFSISPGGGYILSDKIALGLNLGFNSSTTKEDNANFSSKETSSTFFVSPFVRYFLMLEDNFGFTGTFNIRVSSSNSKSETKIGSVSTTIEEPKISGLSIGITPGVIFFPSSKIGIEGNIGFLGYSSTTSKAKNSNTETTTNNSQIGFNVDSFQPSFNVGFYYYLGE